MDFPSPFRSIVSAFFIAVILLGLALLSNAVVAMCQGRKASLSYGAGLP